MKGAEDDALEEAAIANIRNLQAIVHTLGHHSVASSSSLAKIDCKAVTDHTISLQSLHLFSRSNRPCSVQARAFPSSDRVFLVVISASSDDPSSRLFIACELPASGPQSISTVTPLPLTLTLDFTKSNQTPIDGKVIGKGKFSDDGFSISPPIFGN